MGREDLRRKKTATFQQFYFYSTRIGRKNKWKKNDRAV